MKAAAVMDQYFYLPYNRQTGEHERARHPWEVAVNDREDLLHVYPDGSVNVIRQASPGAAQALLAVKLLCHGPGSAAAWPVRCRAAFEALVQEKGRQP